MAGKANQKRHNNKTQIKAIANRIFNNCMIFFVFLYQSELLARLVDDSTSLQFRARAN